MFLIQLDLNYSFLLFQLLNFSKAVKIRKKNYIGTFLIPGPRQIHIHTYRLNNPFLLSCVRVQHKMQKAARYKAEKDTTFDT